MAEQHGFPVRWLNRAALKDEYGLTTKAAILSTVAALVDPYRLASPLLRRLRRQGTRVFDRTQVKSITATTRSVQFALAYGGNGITYSMLGAGLLRAQIERRRHPLTALFSFARLAV